MDTGTSNTDLEISDTGSETPNCDLEISHCDTETFSSDFGTSNFDFETSDSESEIPAVLLLLVRRLGSGVVGFAAVPMVDFRRVRRGSGVDAATTSFKVTGIKFSSQFYHLVRENGLRAATNRRKDSPRAIPIVPLRRRVSLSQAGDPRTMAAPGGSDSSDITNVACVFCKHRTLTPISYKLTGTNLLLFPRGDFDMNRARFPT